MTMAIGTTEPEPDMSDMARMRSGLYGFLAVIYRQEPDLEVLRQLRQPEFQDALSSAGSFLDLNLLSRDEEQLLLDLTLEYTRLFIGPGRHISPHESVHRKDGEGGLWGASTSEVKRFTEALGFTCREDYQGMPDHISAELEFMQAVTGMEAQAWEEDDGETAAHCLRIEGQFINEHLAQWIPQFCGKVIAAAELPFYAEIAGLTRDFIAQEQGVDHPRNPTKAVAVE